MIKYIAIDSGKYATKAITLLPDGTEKPLVFRTKMEETLRTGDNTQGQSFIVQYNGKKYLVGEQAEVNSATTSKAEELHRITTYTALHQLANTGDQIILALGCPLSAFQNSESVENFKRYMFPSREFDIKVGTVTKHITIRSIVILPEASGILHIDENLNNGLVGIIDIGGLNVSAFVSSHGMPILSTMYTDTLGSNVLMQNLKNALSIKYSLDVPMWMMEEILTTGHVIDNSNEDGIRDGSEEFIRNFKRKHIEAILKKCEANGWSLSMMKLVFVGGTSEMLRNEIKAVLPGATIFPEAHMTNVRGFLKAITE